MRTLTLAENPSDKRRAGEVGKRKKMGEFTKSVTLQSIKNKAILRANVWQILRGNARRNEINPTILVVAFEQSENACYS